MFFCFKVATNFITAVRETSHNETLYLIILKAKKQQHSNLIFFLKIELETHDSSNNYTRVPLKRAFLLRGHKKMVPLSGGPTYPGSQLSGVF